MSGQYLTYTIRRYSSDLIDANFFFGELLMEKLVSHGNTSSFQGEKLLVFAINDVFTRLGLWPDSRFDKIIIFVGLDVRSLGFRNSSRFGNISEDWRISFDVRRLVIVGVLDGIGWSCKGITEAVVLLDILISIAELIV